MTKPVAISRFPVSLFATPNPAHQDIFYTVPRAGHLIAGPEHHIKRTHFPGHELIYCLKGKGWLKQSGQKLHIQKGDLIWINCHQPHEYGANFDQPWEVYWVRIEGPKLERMCNILSVSENPVFNNLPYAECASFYQQLFDLIPSSAPEAPARIHAVLANLLALAFCARNQQTQTTPIIPASLNRPVERMKLFFFEHHTVATLAKMARMSPTHFSRVFKASFGTSPIDWLRRERINQAKRRLAETTASIKEIAEQTGYRDRYFFSKDFKRHTGLTPREFRRREQS